MLSKVSIKLKLLIRYYNKKLRVSMVTLTPQAFLMEQYLKNRAQDKADKKRQQRFDNKIAIASVLIPLITFILGLFVEHWAGIAQWFLSLF